MEMKDKYYVQGYDCESYCDVFEKFEQLQEALDYIQKQITVKDANLSDFQMIVGKPMRLETREVTTKVMAFHQK